MEITSIDARLLAKMFVQGTANLTNHRDVVNALNVFPVPDGDTGTNMSLTMNTAMEKVTIDLGSVDTVAQVVSKGSLMGARGNSGVILSQIFRGFAKGCKGKQELSVKDFVVAMKYAKESAYSAVLKPVEGTMLTVIKDIANGLKAVDKKKATVVEMFEVLMKAATESLANTPNLLPVLKDAGVVDSGGQGLVYFFKGMQDAVLGKEVVVAEKATAPAGEKKSAQAHFHAEDIHFLYCTEFILKVDREPDKSFRKKLESMGDSMVFVRDEELLKVHIHTNNPGEALEMALRHGELVTIKIENMKEQHHHIVEEGEYAAPTMPSAAALPKAATADSDDEVVEKKEEHYELANDTAFVAVASGAGIKTILEDLGIDYVIEGGQTMNPSTSDFVEAIGKLKAKEVVLFPNNGNIIMAAEQARTLLGDHIHVVPTKSIPQCVAAIIAYDNGASLKQSIQLMQKAMEGVKTISVTHSVRSTEIDGLAIKEGDYLAVLDKGIVATGADLVDISFDGIKKAVTGETEIITLYTGRDVDEESTNALVERLQEAYPGMDVMVYFGGQPVYYYIISVE